ncbi:MAG TPA: glycosyltransferase family A protein [Bryobacteraceae bacterium]|nr:glycosyltransferase family A protein [Bryobacteraceae bacterium]
MTPPLVTCMMLTRNRREWLPRAIACYQAQTYANRELLIVMDGEDVRDVIPADTDHSISVHYLSGAPPMPIGAKRNFACGEARGEIIAHFDDDDFSAPGRLEDQVQRLLETGKSVTGYHAMRYTDGSNWWEYRNASIAYAVGLSLCYRRTFWERHQFREIQLGEDNIFVAEAAAAGELATADAGELMYGTIHAGNTSHRNTNSHVFRKIA